MRGPLELFAVPADGSEIQFDGTPLAPGTHLRWSFSPELGWPTRGFEVWRRFWAIDLADEFRRVQPQPWVRIASPNLPAAAGIAAAIRQRARTVLSGAATATYELEAASLARLVELIRSATTTVEATRGSSHLDMPAKDILLLGALDPYLARAIGLAYLDGMVAPMMPADYRVHGNWGGLAWPWTETRFDDLSAIELAGGLFDRARSRWFSDRVLSLASPADGAAVLQLDGAGALTLRIAFARPAREVEIDLAMPSAADAHTRWRLTGRAGPRSMTTATSPAIAVAAAGATLRITAPADRLLDEIEIRDTAAGVTSWRITRLRHRAGTGVIRSQQSRIVRVAPVPGPAIPEPHDSVAWPPPAVETPTITATRIVPVASALGDDGRVKLASSQVDVIVARPAAVEVRPDLTRPVRLHAGYVRAAGAAPARTEVITTPLPPPARMLFPVGFWRLDGTMSAVGSGPTLVARGTVRHVDERPMSSRLPDMRRRTVFLTGRADPRDPAASAPGYLEAAIPGLDAIGAELHVQIWAMPMEDPESYATLVGNNYQQSFWFGLAKAAGRYRLRLWLNGQMFESSGTIPSSAWSHVAVHYDSERVVFFINGLSDVSHAAALGPVRPNPRRTLCIGCDPVPPDQPFAYPFAGYLADVQVRRGSGTSFALSHSLAAWSFDGDLRERRSGTVAAAIGTARYAVDHPEIGGRRSAQFDGSWCATALASRLADPGRRLCLKLRIKPDPAQATPVIAGTRHWKLALRADGSGYRLVFSIGRHSVTSSEILTAGRWSNVIAGADGERAVLYVDARPALLPTDLPNMRYGRIAADASGMAVIGADAVSRAGALIAAYRGLIADIEAGDTLPAPSAPLILIDREHSRALEDPFAPSPAPPATAEPPGDCVLRDLGAGTYRFLVQGVDLFGRVGRPLTSASVRLVDVSTPPRPGGARARFLPLRGEVTAVAPPTGEAPHWRVEVRLSRSASVEAAIAARLPRHDAELARVTPDPREPGRRKIERSENYEIARAEPAPTGLVLHLISPALPGLRPAAGLRVTIAHDLWARTEWSWTGTQRLLAPDVGRFALFERRRAGDGWSAWAALGGSIAVVHGDVIAQDESTAPLEARPVTYPQWRELRDQGVATLPEPLNPADPPAPSPPPRRRLRSRIWRIVLPGREPLPDNPARMPPHLATPDDFVAGALAAYNAAPDVLAWQIFAVLWHEWSATAGWALYVVENSKGRETASDAPPVLSQARYYPGQRYRGDAKLGTPPAFGPDAAGYFVPTLPVEIAVAAIDAAGRKSPIEAEPGEPRTGGAADVVAVDRRRPLPPPPPAVTIDRADYYGQSRATVSWVPVDGGASYQVYRAIDSAVYARDTEQRRRGTGFYEGADPDTRVADDDDFEDWIRERFPEWVHDWATRLFVEKPTEFAEPGRETTWRQSRDAWDAASVVWRAWIERFYPSLNAVPRGDGTLSPLQEIAERHGNESAFSLINSKPIEEAVYLDRVNGTVRNHYLYRLRTLSSALLPSSQWGAVSIPAKPTPYLRAPERPIVTRIEPGDRRITLNWILNREANLAGYRLYRTQSAEALGDLRWWRPDRDPRLLRDETELLRPDAIAGGSVSFVDEGVSGEQYYRVVAVSVDGVPSEGSTVVSARSLEITPPPPPSATLERVEEDRFEDRVRIRFAVPGDLQVAIQRRLAGGLAWTNVQPWRNYRESVFDETVPADEHYEYRLLSRTALQVVSEPTEILPAPPRRGAS